MLLKKKYFKLLSIIIFALNSCGSLVITEEDKKQIKKIKIFEFTQKDNLHKINRDSVILNNKFSVLKRYTKTGSYIEDKIYGRNGKLLKHRLFKFNEFNRFKSCVTYYKGEFYEKLLYFYDKNQRQITVSTFNADSVLVFDNHFEYIGDKMTKLTANSYKHNSGFEYRYIFNKRGKLIVMNSIHNNKIESSTYYKFNKSSGKNEKKLFVRNTLKGKKSKVYRKYKYDKFSNVIFEVFKTAKYDKKYHKKYDKHNNLIEQIDIDNINKRTNHTMYSYDYDYNNNWVTKKRYHNGILKSIILREINYYD